MQKFIVIGNLTADAESKTFENGNSVINFSVAVNESYVNKDGEQVENVEYFDVRRYVTKSPDKLMEYLKKGKTVAVDGKWRTDQWEKDGVKQSKRYVVADTVELH